MHKVIASADGGIQVPLTEEKKAELFVEWSKADAEKAATHYISLRQDEYASFGEQLDMLWHDIDDGLIAGKDSAWFKCCKAVKDKHVKPQV